MIKLLGLFFTFKGANPWLVLFCLFLASSAEGLSIAGALPLIALATDDGNEEQSELSLIMADAFAWLGIDPTLEVLLLIIVGGIVGKALMTLVAMRLVGHAAATVSTELRRDLVDGLLKVRWSFFASQPVGRIASAMSNEATRAGRAYVSTATFIANTVQTLIYIILAFLIAWKIALGAVIVCTLIGIALHRFVRQSKRAGREQTKRTSEMIAYLTDGLSNVKPLKAMAKQAAFESMVDKKIVRLRRALRRQVNSQEWLKASQQILFILLLGVALWSALTFDAAGLGELLIIALVLVQTVNKIGRIQRDYQTAVNQGASHEALSELSTKVRESAESWQGTRTPAFERNCRFDKVCFSFGERAVLKDVSFDLARGSLTVLMGASGGGKTTITDLLLGLYWPDDGRILIDDVPLDEIDLDQWRSRIGYVAQELVLFHDSIAANVALGDPAIAEEEIVAALKTAGAWDFIEQLPEGIHATVGERGSRLSGGQRQRIALARALIGKPKLLILDEVTSALDPETEQEICQTLAALSEDHTIITITHRPQLLEIADQILELSDGVLRQIPAPLPLKRERQA
ncbi:ABC transporter ATP-binding protein [Aquibaculum arenosum]|uniref:ABC transporter ATP-binding protein n=1 Tax=Aquibaculum arenosum TaxID=3032591 RepID=A0ABT5YHE8_9PROT|nr:ABC transporter ATP-binding protein [Fodinicurvata sp. CAU 1616]MDF2094366.1 ABC transporter ATP-binding protein [Fodinicurvata sp. CAU 1616]